jgi:pimeloyl-ACP methyl ester carboxylesterase
LIRRVAIVGSLMAVPAALVRLALGRGADRLIEAPRVLPEEAGLAGAVDALGGEVVRLMSRDGLRLAGRWLPAERGSDAAADDWRPDPHEAILLLHGWSGSIAPDLVEYGPLLRRTAGVLGLDFRGHGESAAAPTTFGLHEVEDVAGALAWFAERGVTRVALVGSSMGGITALAAIAVLGDGSLPAADLDPNAPAHDVDPPRPLIVGAVVESVPSELTVPVGKRMRMPFGRFFAGRLFDAAGRRVGGDMRATEPIKVAALVETVPILLIHGAADRTIPERDARRLATAMGAHAEQWVVPGAAHSAANATDPVGYEERVSAFLRRAFADARSSEPIIGRLVSDEPPAGSEQEGD